jgi:hypothetical protein
MTFCDHSRPQAGGKEDCTDHSPGWPHICDRNQKHRGRHRCACGAKWALDMQSIKVYPNEGGKWGPIL